MIENPCEKCKWFELPLNAYPCRECVFSGELADHFEAKEEQDEADK